jgi:hypothetical protein
VLVAIVNAAREASELRANVPVFKDLRNPEHRDRVGVASYKRLAEVLDGHDKGDLASRCELGLLAVALP